MGETDSTKEVAIDLLAGWSSGAISILFSQPIDTILTRRQANNVIISSSSNSIINNNKVQTQCSSNLQQSRLAQNVSRMAPSHYSTQNLIQKYGVSSLWRGSSAMIGAIPFQNALLMAGYGFGKRCSEKNHDITNVNVNVNVNQTASLSAVFVGGVTGGIAQSFLMSPVELIKVHQQVIGKSFSSATNLVVTGIFSRSVAWRGLNATLLRDGIPHGVWFCSYEYSKSYLERIVNTIKYDDDLLNSSSSSSYWSKIFKKYHDSLIPLSSGAFAAITAWGVGYPFDIIKTRIQASNTSVEEKSITQVLREIIHESSSLSSNHSRTICMKSYFSTVYQMKNVVQALYKGFGLKLAKAVPASAINFFVYEKVSTHLNSKM